MTAPWFRPLPSPEREPSTAVLSNPQTIRRLLSLSFDFRVTDNPETPLFLYYESRSTKAHLSFLLLQKCLFKVFQLEGSKDKKKGSSFGTLWRRRFPCVWDNTSTKSTLYFVPSFRKHFFRNKVKRVQTDEDFFLAVMMRVFVGPWRRRCPCVWGNRSTKRILYLFWFCKVFFKETGLKVNVCVSAALVRWSSSAPCGLFFFRFYHVLFHCSSEESMKCLFVAVVSKCHLANV